MKQGKQICETLKAIRRDIAEANEIDYTPTECHHEGDCAGTCPKCESDMRWLEKQLRSRQALGKAVTIAGLSLALGAMTSCHHHKHYSLDSSDESEESLECSTESGDITAGVVDESFFKSTSKDGDTIHNFTPLKGGDEDGVSFKDSGNDGDDKYQVMGEVAVDENGNTYGPE